MNQSSIVEQLVADPIANYPAATVACFDPTAGELPRRRLDEDRTVAIWGNCLRLGCRPCSLRHLPATAIARLGSV